MKQMASLYLIAKAAVDAQCMMHKLTHRTDLWQRVSMRSFLASMRRRQGNEGTAAVKI